MFKKAILAAAVILSMHQAQAQVNDQEDSNTSTEESTYSKPQKDYRLWLNLGAGVNFLELGTISDSQVSFQPELGAAYYFSPNVGLFTGLGHTNYSAESEGFEFDVSYLDVPVGMSFKYDNGFIPDAKSTYNLGVYYALPTSDLEVEGMTLADAKGHAGLYFGGLTTFSVNEKFDMGFGSTIKVPLGDVVDLPNNNALSVALNFVLMY